MAAVEEETIIKKRYLTQTVVARGDPPFKKLVKRYCEFSRELQSNNVQKAEELLPAVLADVSAIQFQFAKTQAVCDANRREQQSYVEKQMQLEAAIEQARDEFARKKVELEEARVISQHNEEYEALRRLCMEVPSRRTTQAELDKLQRELERVEAEGIRAAQTIERRRKQFALLLHAVEELQQTIAEEAVAMEDAPDGMVMD